MKRILYVTGSRAEYGIMKRLLRKLYEDPEIDLRIVATAMQIDEKYGYTYKVIEEDGFFVDALVDIDLQNDTNQQVLHSMAIGLDKFGQYLATHEFDAVIILGDRYEMLSVAIAAAMHNIPIIHLHGGEITLGNYDEFIRHAITKMSKLHLVATEEYQDRVIQLGEHPDTVFNIGSLGAENTMQLPLCTEEVIRERCGLGDKPYFVVLFHPETLTGHSIEDQVKALLEALDAFVEEYTFVFLGANSDTGSQIIYELIHGYATDHNCAFLPSVKPEEYLSVVKYSQGLIGNSSSGLIEIPSLHVPTLNLGDRQKGRVRGKTVIDVPVEREAIIEGIRQMISPSFVKAIQNEVNPYGGEHTMEKAHEIIKKAVFGDALYEIKAFYDLPKK